MMEGLASHDLVENSDCSDNAVEKKKKVPRLLDGGPQRCSRSAPVHQGQMVSAGLSLF